MSIYDDKDKELKRIDKQLRLIDMLEIDGINDMVNPDNSFHLLPDFGLSGINKFALAQYNKRRLEKKRSEYLESLKEDKNKPN